MNQVRPGVKGYQTVELTQWPWDNLITGTGPLEVDPGQEVGVTLRPCSFRQVIYTSPFARMK